MGDVHYKFVDSLVYVDLEEGKLYEQVPTGGAVFGRVLKLVKVDGKTKQQAYQTSAQELCDLALVKLAGYPTTMRLLVKMIKEMYDRAPVNRMRDATFRQARTLDLYGLQG